MLVKFVIIIISVFVLLALGYVGFVTIQPKLIAWNLDFPQPQYEVAIDSDVMIASADGTKLATDIYRPDAEGKFPVIIARTPYDKTSSRHMYPFLGKIFAGQGYVFVTQDVRGKNNSEGTFTPYENEAMDGEATIEWAGKAEWSNGNVALFGFSYLGSCAWLAATKDSPYLKTIIPLFTSQDTYKGWYDRGVPHLKDMLYWVSKYHVRTKNHISHEEIDKVLTNFPANELDQALTNKHLKTYQEYIRHPTPDAFWDKLGAEQKLGDLDIPILFYAGWYDRFIESSLEDFSRMRSQTSAPVRIVIGPWVHDPTMRAGDIALPNKAKFADQFKVILHWFDMWLKHNISGSTLEYPITYFVMGKNEWHHADQWPPADVSYKPLYLTSKDRILSPEQEASSHTVEYTYDPTNPTPSIGTKMVYANGWEGAAEQGPLTKRSDVVTFLSEPLKSEMVIAGPTKLILHVASSAVDTDFSAKIADKHPNGKAYFIQSGYMRMRYRDSLKDPKLITPGEIYEIEISIASTGHAFKKGHRIQLQISSSDYPNHSRNLNTATIPEEASSPNTAIQAIHFGGDYESKLLLPVLSQY
ncbi:MAG: Cocaine esterase [Chlamydiae bacterium]|nr:Cocaine esterase [Chlamydiota bacterium]